MSFCRAWLFHVALIVFLGLLVYSNTLGVPFQFDDIPNVQENPLIRNLSNIPLMFSGGTGPFASRPLMHATIALNYRLGGLDPTGYHAFNIALHLINGILLYFLVVMTGKLLKYSDEGTRPVALLASLVFVTHPVQTDAVTYVVSRSMLLATTFYLLGIMLFAKAVTSEKRRGLYIAGLFFTSLLGAASRENFVTFPVILILYDLLFISGFRAKEALRHWKAYLPILPACIYLVFLALNNTYDLRAEHAEIAIPPLSYVVTQFNVHWTYLRLLALPINQNLDYDYPIADTLLQFPTVLSFLGYIALWAAGIFFSRRRPIVAMSIFWFAVALAPISFGVALTDLRLGDVIFEHRLYLPSAGIFAGFSAMTVSATRGINLRWAKMAVALCLALSVAVFSVASYKRNELWRSGISLWEDVVDKSPNNARGYIHLAHAYGKEGQLDAAIHYYLIALTGDFPPLFADHYAAAHYNLANTYFSKGLLDNAIEHYLIALKLYPMFADAYYNLGVAYLQTGLFDKAIENFNVALRASPHNSDKIHNNMGIANMQMGLTDRAIEHFRAAISINPRHAKAHRNLGDAYMRKGMPEEARRHFDIADSLIKSESGPGRQ